MSWGLIAGGHISGGLFSGGIYPGGLYPGMGGCADGIITGMKNASSTESVRADCINEV